jgi:hypothetical protein
MFLHRHTQVFLYLEKKNKLVCSLIIFKRVQKGNRRGKKIASHLEVKQIINLSSLLESCKDPSPTDFPDSITIDNSIWNSYGVSVVKTLGEMPLKKAQRVRHKIENAIFESMSMYPN